MRTLSLLAVVTLLASCTTYYRPVSEWEQRYFDVATFDVFPDDVRSSPSQYSDSILAWAGVVDSWSIDESTDPELLHLEMDHRFFSWAMDVGTQQFWPSPRGEGRFIARWPNPGWSLEELRENIRVGDLFIVYGTAQQVQADGTVDFGQAEYVRLIPQEQFRDDRIDYGRPGEPTKVLDVF
ncbi:MAG: hypothetical protein AAGH76_01470 [Pseudomonadota bacterium]